MRKTTAEGYRAYVKNVQELLFRVCGEIEFVKMAAKEGEYEDIEFSGNLLFEISEALSERGRFFIPHERHGQEARS
ncbi:hypothetical protein [Piscirickettsia litoralis]|uniref:Uncharacterized protein n=1 Tax=Piscirickettsia litoralis TaxID=1891921 RepID=A0ABX2ZXP5_9GAMM|nr:hypothetical protein [Piscirickettsia litoralis]ODN41382.1 hypothetical protein BGC07_16570 [Piscirickettsia litoralis]